MAHCQPMTKGSLKRVLREEWRELKSYKNNVDRSRTDMNYSMRGRSPEQILELLDNRCKEVMQGRKMQKQTNVAFSWVISTPVPLKGNEDKTKQFFSAVYDFLEERYGKDNVLEGMVHMDEDNPHMHATIVSEAVSRKTGKRTISAASLITRNELKAFHTDLDKHIENVMGVKGLVKNGRTVGNLSLPEYKTVIAQKNKNLIKEIDLEQREKNLNERSSRLSKLETDYNNKASEFNKTAFELNKEIMSFNKKEEDLQKEKEQLKQREAEFDKKWSKLDSYEKDLSNREIKLNERLRQAKMSETERTSYMVLQKLVNSKGCYANIDGKSVPLAQVYKNRIESYSQRDSFKEVYESSYDPCLKEIKDTGFELG